MAATLGQIGNGYPSTTPGGYSFGSTLEPGIKGSHPVGGYPASRAIPLNDWRTATDASLGTSAGATPYRAMANTSIPTITWRFDATTTDLIRTSFVVPNEYDPNVDDLRLIAWARKVDAASDENATLALGCVARILTMGQTDPTLAAATTPAAPGTLQNSYVPSITGDTSLTAVTQVNRLLVASSTGADTSTFAGYEFNLGVNGIKPCDLVILELFPSATVGSADMVLQLAATHMVFHRAASFFNRQLRFQDKALFGN